MSPTFDELHAEAMKLSAEERAELADRLWASIKSNADLDVEWSQEIERRVREIEYGEVETFSMSR